MAAVQVVQPARLQITRRVQRSASGAAGTVVALRWRVQFHEQAPSVRVPCVSSVRRVGCLLLRLASCCVQPFLLPHSGPLATIRDEQQRSEMKGNEGTVRTALRKA
jgi:hypothetical protein